MATFNSLSNNQIEFMRGFSGKQRKEAHEAFMREYKCDVNYYTFKQWMQRLGIKASGSGRFDGTQKPWAKGLSKEEFWERYSDESKARMLNAPREANRTARVGNVRIKREHGVPVPYITISTDPALPHEEKREPLRRFIWKKKCGNIPDDHMIIHLNGNTLDCRIENLAMIPKRYRPVVLKQVRSGNPEICKASIMYCELMDAIRKGEKNGNIDL